MSRINLSIRNAKFAKIGLMELCDYVTEQIGSDISILEIGSFSGDSGKIFAESTTGPVICVDPWESNYDPTGTDLASNPEYYDMREVEARFDEMAEPFFNILKWKMTSEEAVNKVTGEIDFIYIDALHTYEGVKRDIELWLPKAKHFIGGHDYRSRHHPGVQLAIDEEFGNPDRLFRDSSWLVKI